MADNTVLSTNVGTGDAIATASLTFSGDTAKVQAIGVGLLSGSEGSWTYSLLVGGAGAVAAGVQRVTLASDDPAVVSLAVLDDWDESDRAKVNVIVGQAGVDGNSGNKSAATLRVVLATDQPALTNKLLVTPDLPSGASTAAKQPALGTAGTASADVITVQGIASMTPLLATCTFASAQAVTQSGTWDIGTVSTVTAVTTVATVTSLTQFNGNAIDTNSGSKSAGTLRVVLATDQPALTNKLLVTPDLPSGASTAAKQPALGTAGTAATDVITVQGIASMTPLLATCTFASAQAVTQSGTWNIATVTTVTTVSTVTAVTTVSTVTNLSQMGGAAISMGTGTRDAGTQRVTIATNDVVPCSQSGTWTVTGAGGTFPVTDNSGSLTVDAPVGTPVFVRLSDGAAAITTLPVSMAAVPTGASTAAKQPALGTAGTASADVITIQGIASMTKLLVTPDANSAVNVGQINGVTPLMGNGATGTGALRVSIANDSTGIVNPGNTANTTPWLVTDTPATSGGLSVSRVIDFSGTDQGKTSIKGSAGQVFGIVVTNTNAAVRYLKLYNASAPTSASTPVITLAVPGNTAGSGMVMNFDKGIAFGTAIGMRATTGYADNDANAVAAGEVIANVMYK